MVLAIIPSAWSACRRRKPGFTAGNSPFQKVGRAAGLNSFRWTLSGDGSLRLDYDYTLNGDYRYHGITFDHPEDQMKSLRWLGDGPYRVWQNRLRGTWLGIHDVAYNDIQPGESWDYPEFQGMFSGLRWADLETSAGRQPADQSREYDRGFSSGRSLVPARDPRHRVQDRQLQSVLPSGEGDR
jgi:Beta galactosidase small chain